MTRTRRQHWFTRTAAPIYVACVVLLSSAVAAQTPVARGPALNWVRLPGAETCIAPVELAQRIEARLGHRVFVPTGDAIIVLEGQVGPARESGFTTSIRVSDADGTVYGTRDFSMNDADCRKLDELVTLIMAITIHHQEGSSVGIALPPQIMAQLDALFADEASSFDPSELPAAKLHAAELTVQLEPKSAHTSSSSAADGGKRSQPGLAVAIEAGFGLATGLQPSATFAPSLGLRAGREELGSLLLTLRPGLPQRQTFAAEPGGSIESVPGQVAIAACPPAWQLWASELTLCADVRVSGLRVTARGWSSRNETKLELWPEVAAHAHARTRLIGPSYLHLRLGVPLRLRRPEFQYVDSQGAPRQAFQVQRVGFEIEAGLGLTL